MVRKRTPRARLGQTAFAIGLAASCLGAAAQSEGVSLEAFGLGDVADVAHCVSKNLPSGLSNDIAMTYWAFPINLEHRCVKTDQLEDAVVGRSRARPALLSALSQCTGQRYTDDRTPWVRRVAHADALIAANGVFLHEVQMTRLQHLLKLTADCASPEPKLRSAEATRAQVTESARRFDDAAKDAKGGEPGRCLFRQLPDGTKKLTCG